MTPGRRYWLNELARRLTPTNPPWATRLEQLNEGELNTGVVQQRQFLGGLSSNDLSELLNAALKTVNFKEPTDPVAKKFHDALLAFHINKGGIDLPDLYDWSRSYKNSPFFRPPPEQRKSLDQALKTRRGNIRMPISSLYRLIRGNMHINESKDVIAQLANRHWDPQVTNAIKRLSNQGYIKYDPRTGVLLIPRNTMRQIDPYYEQYHTTLVALANAIKQDRDDAWNGVSRNPTNDELGTKYRAMGKAFAQDQLRRTAPRIPEDIPLEERNRLLALQQERLENISPEAISNAVQQMINLGDLLDVRNAPLGSWPRARPQLSILRVASMFTEKGLRRLLNNPKRLLILAKINEMLEDKWQDLLAKPRLARYIRADDTDIDANVLPYEAINAIPYADYDELATIERPGGIWRDGDLNSLNDYEAFQRRLAENEQRLKRRRVQARERILQYIAAHPELQQLAEQNAAERQQQDRLRTMRGIGYTANAEDAEEGRLIDVVTHGVSGYKQRVGKILDNPRLVELAKRPYQYSEGITDAISAVHGWQLAQDRYDLYNRTLNHGICVGDPMYAYHDKVLAKKSLIFFSGDHTDPESETGEIALYIDPKTHKIIQAEIAQVHGFGNKPGSETGTQNLQYIADALTGVSVNAIDNVVEQQGIDYQENDPQQEQEELWDDDDDDDADDEGYVGGGYVEPTGNPAYRRLLELLLEDGMTKPTKHLTSLATRRF